LLKDNFKINVKNILKNEFCRRDMKSATVNELYYAVSRAAISAAYDNAEAPAEGKRACYFSAEYLIGRLIYDNLNNLGLTDTARELLGSEDIEFSVFEQIEDAALGNGGLGRLAACFLDSAATHCIPLDGYGIRYRYGLFRQFIENGFQREQADIWQSFGDPWSFRRDDESVIVEFSGSKVKAVPYDTPVIGFGGKCINTLRLWQSEPVEEFCFDTFNQNRREEAFAQRNAAEQISAVLYPNDGTYEGRQLRLKQQYFFCSASLQDILRKYKAKHGSDFSKLHEEYAIQLNDTHPVCSIPELMRLLMDTEGLSFDEAFEIINKVFAYTNHTVMPEALEKWDARLIFDTVPQIYDFIVLIDRHLRDELKEKGISGENAEKYHIVDNGLVHMARLAVYATFSTNGVAWLHTEILKDSCLGEWYELYPERFNNKTNGITQRRWLSLCNPGLSRFISERIGDGWITDLDELKKLEQYADDEKSLSDLLAVKKACKSDLSAYIEKKEGVSISSEFIFDIQVKRLHEYKRQFLNALSILDLYYGIKDGRIKDFVPTAFIFGAKAFPTYRRAKGIVKLINEIARLIENDPEVSKYIKVHFVSNYNVSYAEKLIPAADISEQISTAGTEASGTGNMKFMLNGAVTLGTYDGANVEIVQQAGFDNNYIFGARVEDIEKIADSYNPMDLYNSEPRIQKVVDALIDGTLDDGGEWGEGEGSFTELRKSLLEGASWHKADNYYLLYDLIPYCDAKLKVNADYKRSHDFARKMLMNIANAGLFSSDRTIKQYADEIWHV